MVDFNMMQQVPPDVIRNASAETDPVELAKQVAAIDMPFTYDEIRANVVRDMKMDMFENRLNSIEQRLAKLRI